MITFESLGLSNEVLQAVKELGFEKPSEIQEKAIPHLLTGNTDFVGLAQTGTGKTAAFGLPLAQLVDFSSNSIQALVICPTRELCNQITEDFKTFTKFHKSAHIVAVYGGASIEGQLRELKRGPQIVIATPGRMMDFLDRKAVKLDNIKFIVLDEADEMLNMGFKDAIDDILKFTPKEKHTWLFSATMPTEVARIAGNYMEDPFEVTIGKKNSSNVNLEHHFFVIEDRSRYSVLKRLLDFHPEIFGLVFCRTRTQTKEISEKLAKDGYNADALHGDLSQQQRDAVMGKFREKTIRILVATDVAARGIDVNEITHVIHFNLPEDIENYTHRAGRTARAGKTGQSMLLVNQRESGRIKEIERLIGTRFTHSLVPSGREVCENQLFSLITKIQSVKVNEKEIAPYLPKINELLGDLSREELVKRFVSEEFNRLFDYYQNSADLNKSMSERGGVRGEGRDRSLDNTNFTRLFVNFGSLDNIHTREMMKIICDKTNISSKSIGRIDIKREFSFVEVENDIALTVVDGLNGQMVDGRKMRVEKTEEKAPRERSSRSSYGSSGGSSSSSSRGGSRRPSGDGEKKSYAPRERSSFSDRERSSSSRGDGAPSRDSAPSRDAAPSRDSYGKRPRTSGDDKFKKKKY
jgi:ATP-dependent RNA helicase DeaD